MILPNTITPVPKPFQPPTPFVQSNSNPPLPPPTKKPILLYLFIFLIICLLSFILWSGFKLYQTKYPPIFPGTYACSPNSECSAYPETFAFETCPITFDSKTCDNQCSNPINHCLQ